MFKSDGVFGNWFVLLGRIAISLLFIFAGVMKLWDFSGTAEVMAQQGMYMPHVWLVLAIIIELGCGLLLFVGWWTRLAALLLILFIVPVTYVFHGFWLMEGAEMASNLTHFMKNFSIIGGLLYVFVFGAGSWSVDHKYKK